jgi:hypothetical protein
MAGAQRVKVPSGFKPSRLRPHPTTQRLFSVSGRRKRRGRPERTKRADLADETVQNLGWSGCSTKRTPGPALGDGVVPVERAVHCRGWDFQHQMSAPRRPSHLLLSIHSAVQQPLHRALGDRRRNRFFASAGCRVVDDEIGLSGYVGLEIAQKTRNLARGRFDRRRIVSCGVTRDQSFANEIERTPDLTMPETPTDLFDGVGEASASLAITLRGIRPTLGRLGLVGFRTKQEIAISADRHDNRIRDRAY